MADKKIEIARGMHSIGVSASITGKTRTVTVLNESRSGDSETIERKVDERVENVVQFKEATRLVNRARATLKKFGKNVGTLGFLTGESGASAFCAEIDGIAVEVEAHNGESGQEHTIVLETSCLPIGMILDEKHMHGVYKTVNSELATLLAVARAGDIEQVAYWLQRNRTIAGLMPALIARAVQDAIDSVTEILTILRAEINEAHRTASEVGGELDLTLVESAIGMTL